MTVSTTVDVSDSVDEARTRLLKTARALNRAWAAALCSVALLPVGSVALLLVAFTVEREYVVIWSVLLAATSYNLTRYWPRRRARPGTRLDRRELAELRSVVDPEAVVAWPSLVRLVPRAELELAEGELVLGVPLLACLDASELGVLLRVAAGPAGLEAERSVRWALRVAHGDVGRPLVSRGPHLTWLSSLLTERLRRRAAQLEADLGNWAAACECAAGRASGEAASVIASRDQVADAWALLRTEWLEPAFERGCRHAAPFSGLRAFVEAAEAAGWMTRSRPWSPAGGAAAEIVARYEESVALEIDEHAERRTPIGWEQHPDEVTVPRWRALVDDVLDAARRTTDEPAVALDSVLRLLESGAGSAPAETALTRILTAAVGIATVDSSQFRPCWSWPDGTVLEAPDGWRLPLEAIVSEVVGMVRDGEVERAYAELREALDQLGVDVHEPLWLGHGAARSAERPVGSFAGRQGFTARVVVVTDRALHLFRDSRRRRVGNPERPPAPASASVELRRWMLAVWQGDTFEQVLTLAAEDVRVARLGPGVGGLWWRLTLVSGGGTVVLRGLGDGLPEEVEIKEWLGDRVETVWLHAPPTLRTIRNVVGLVGMSLGTLALAWGVLLTVTGPGRLPTVLPPVLSLGGFGALLVALAPDWVQQLRSREARLPE